MEKEQYIQIMNKLDNIEQSLSYQKRVLTFDEAAKFTGLSKSYLYKLTASKQIPHYKPAGKLVYFEIEELEAWVFKNKISTEDELESESQSYCMYKMGKR